MAVLSGKDGNVTWNGGAISQVTGWNCTETARNSAWASSNTAGYKHRVCGVRDWSGWFSAKYDGSIAATVGQGTISGTAVSLVLHLNDDESLTGNAIIDSIELEVDVNTGDVVGYTCKFSGTGALTRT